MVVIFIGFWIQVSYLSCTTTSKKQLELVTASFKHFQPFLVNNNSQKQLELVTASFNNQSETVGASHSQSQQAVTTNFSSQAVNNQFQKLVTDSSHNQFQLTDSQKLR